MYLVYKTFKDRYILTLSDLYKGTRHTSQVLNSILVLLNHKLNRFSNSSKNVLNSLSQLVRTVFRHISDTSKFFKIFWRIQLSKESRNLLLKLLYGTEGRLSNSDDISYIFSYSCRHFDLHIHLLFEEKIITVKCENIIHWKFNIRNCFWTRLKDLSVSKIKKNISLNDGSQWPKGLFKFQSMRI